jgi:hypothetical protein
MPETLILQNIGLKGLATDPDSISLPPEFITFGINFRILTGSLTANGGSQLWDTAPVAFFPGHLIQPGVTGATHFVVAGRTAVYVFDGTTWTDISSTAAYTSIGTDQELLWNSCQLGSIPILNNSQIFPEYWAPQQPAQILQPLQFDSGNTWSAKSFSFDIIRSHKTFLFALSLHEGGTDFPDSYRWSHPADINGLPATWDEEDEAFLAGKASLGSDGGKILDGHSLRDAFCIYSEKAIDILDSTNDEFVWRRRELSSTYGLLATGCIAEVKGVHFFLSGGDILRNDGNQIYSIIHDKLKRQFSSLIDVTNYKNSYVVNSTVTKEVWFCVPEAGETYPTIAYIYNWRDDSWAIRELPDDIAFSVEGARSIQAAQWDDPPDEEIWDTQLGSWDSESGSPFSNLIIGVNPLTETLYFVTPDGTPDNDFTARIERTNFPLIDERQVTTITRVYPHITGTTPIKIQFGSQDFNGAPVRWKPVVLFDPNVDRKIDLRTTGELHAWRFETTGKVSWGLSGFTIEFERDGYR